MSCCDLEAGFLLGDRYRILRLLNQGSSGKTWLAVDEYSPHFSLLNADRACLHNPENKYPFSNACCVIKQSALQGKIHEGQMPPTIPYLREVSQQHLIPKLLDGFTHDRHSYLVQEWIEGQNLEQELADTGAFRETDIRQLLKQLLPVLQAIHDRQMIHRDIKPANIIRRLQDGRLALVDFGSAAWMLQVNPAESGALIGNAEYVAPEQTRGKEVFASDLYSLGLTCIHLLTQIPPFDLLDDVEDPRHWREYLLQPLDESLGQILDRLIHPAVGCRYHSARAVLEDLNAPGFIANPVNNLASANTRTIAAFLVSRSEQSCQPQPVWYVPPEPPQPNPRWWMTGAIAVALTCLAAGLQSNSTASHFPSGSPVSAQSSVHSPR